MEFYKKRTSETFFSVVVIFSLSLIFYAIFLGFSQWKPTSPDTVNIAWGIQELKMTQQIPSFWIGGSGYHPGDMNPPFYQWIQQFVATVTPQGWSGVSSYLIVIWFIVASFPVWLFLMVRLFTGDRLVGLSAVLLTWGSFAVLRSLYVTPHNLFGYLGLLVGCYFLLRFFRDHTWWALGFAMIFFILTSLLHPLSGMMFGLVICATLAIEVYKKFGGKGLGIFCLSAILFLSWYASGWGAHNPFEVLIYQVVSSTLWESAFPDFRPFWELPAVWGFLLVLLAIMGWFSYHGKSLPRACRKFLIAFLPIFFLSQSYVLGVYYIIPDRVVAYMWIPFVFLASFGVRELYDDIQERFSFFPARGIFFFCLVLVILLPAVNNANFSIATYGTSVRLDAEYLQSFEWLKNNGNPQYNVLSATYGEHEKILYLPFYFDGKITRYTYSHFDISPYERLKKEGWKVTWLGRILYHFFPSVYDEVKQGRYSLLKKEGELFLMMTKPESEKAQQLMNRYGIRYIWLERATYESRFFEKSKKFNTLFENEKVTIYGRSQNE